MSYQHLELTTFGKKDYIQASAYHHGIYMPIGALPYLLSGMFRTWASPLLTTLQSADSPLGRGITAEEGSWFVSFFYLGILVIGLVSGLLVDTFGRKTMLLTSSIFLCIPCVLISVGTTLHYIYLGRFLAGAGTALANFTSIMYCTEISEERSREFLDVLLITFPINGSCLILLLNPYVPHYVLTILVCVCGIICFILFNILPESPYYLMMIGKYDKAQENLDDVSSFVYGRNSLHSPFLRLQSRINFDIENRITVWTFLTGPEFRNSIILMLGIKTLQYTSGVCAIEPYTHTIIEQTSSKFSPGVSSLIIGAVLLPAMTLTGTIVRDFGRRKLLIISALGSALALICQGAYFFIQDYLQQTTSSIEWLPTVSITCFYVMNYLGVASIPFIMMPETFPSHVKTTALSCVGTYGGCVSFLISKSYQSLTMVLGVYTVMFMFATHCVLGSLFIFAFLPETKRSNAFFTQQALQSTHKITQFSNEESETISSQ